MPCAAAPSTSWDAVADHQHAVGQRLQLGERVRDHVGLGGADAVDAGARDDLEVPSSPKCARIRRAVGSAFEVATASRTPAACRSASSCGDAVEQAVHRPAAGASSRRGRRRSRRRRPRRAPSPQRVVHRRADDAAGQVTVGHLGTDLAECVPEAGHDALRRVGQGAVEVEDHQLRARRDGACAGFCHASIVADV